MNQTNKTGGFGRVLLSVVESLGSVGHAGKPVKLDEEFREVLTQLLQLRLGDRRLLWIRLTLLVSCPHYDDILTRFENLPFTVSDNPRIW